MKGYPKYLNSKADYLYVIEHFPKEKWAPDLQALLDDRVKWIATGKLDNPAKGITGAIHKIEIVESVDKTETEYYQYEFKEDKNCKLLKLGFNKKEIENYLQS